MADLPGLLIRQKLDLLEVVTPLEKRNKYKIVGLKSKDDPDFDGKWEDKAFKKADDLMTAKEDSDFLCRQICRSRREFDMKVKLKGKDNDGDLAYKMHRPFKCTIPCFCTVLNPQEIEVEDHEGNLLGKAVQDMTCAKACCAKAIWKIEDKDGTIIYRMEDNLCCTANMCAPSPCCEVRNISIMTPEWGETSGSLQNIFPGCNLRGLCGTADNYKLTFPDNATPDQKAVLLGAALLIEYMLFEKSDNDQEGGVSISM